MYLILKPDSYPTTLFIEVMCYIQFNFFILILQGFIECLCNHLKKLSEIEKSIFEEIAEWKHLQQRSLCGYPCPPPLDKLQEMYAN